MEKGVSHRSIRLPGGGGPRSSNVDGHDSVVEMEMSSVSFAVP